MKKFVVEDEGDTNNFYEENLINMDFYPKFQTIKEQGYCLCRISNTFEYNLENKEGGSGCDKIPPNVDLTEHVRDEGRKNIGRRRHAKDGCQFATDKQTSYNLIE